MEKTREIEIVTEIEKLANNQELRELFVRRLQKMSGIEVIASEVLPNLNLEIDFFDTQSPRGCYTLTIEKTGTAKIEMNTEII